MRIITFIVIFFLFIIGTINLYSKSYAILLAGGYGNIDEPRYWYDLVLVYEYLVLEAGYNHDDILVFFGDGENWEGSSVNGNRYKLSVRHPDWPDIVDFPNDAESVEDEIRNFADNIITNKDNLLIWVPSSHGTGNPSPEYDPQNTFIDQSGDDISFIFSENPVPDWPPNKIIYNVLYFLNENENKKYKRLKYLWSSCHSGHLVLGNKTLINGGNQYDDDDKTIVFTSCDWDETGVIAYPRGYYDGHDGDNEEHSGFTYSIYCTMMGKDPWDRLIEGFDPNPDINSDGVVNMKELWDAIKYEGQSIFSGISWRSGSNHCIPQIADPCNRAEYLYIDENLKLENATLSLMQGENVRKYRVDKISAGNNLVVPDDSNIEFVVDTEVHFKPGFRAVRGCQLHAYIGEIECP
jgi:hypothetical protein